MITSTTNEKVKLVKALFQRKARQEKGLFIVEGVRLVEEAYRTRLKPEFVLYTSDLSERGQQLVKRWHGSGAVCLQVTPGVMKACTETETPQGILAVLPFVDRILPLRPTLSVVVDGVRDPGNLGTLLRTAAAAGVDEVLLAPGTVDIYNPKVVRAGMGAHFYLPIAAMTWLAINARLAGMQVWLADANGEQPYAAIDWTGPSALIIGGEAAGASPDALKMAAARTRIPMYNQIESLNAAVAAAVILFEAARQRASLAPTPSGA